MEILSKNLKYSILKECRAVITNDMLGIGKEMMEVAGINRPKISRSLK